MARSKQPRPDKTDTGTDADPEKDDVVDAEVVEPDEAENAPVDAAEKTDADETPPDDVAEESAGSERGDRELFSTDEEVTEPATPMTVPMDPPRRGGFWPLFLGGVLAAGVGAIAVLALFPAGWRPADGGGALALSIESQAERISALEDSLNAAEERLAELAARPDATEQVAALRQELLANQPPDDTGAITELGDRLDDLSARVDEIAESPGEGATLSTDQLAAMRAEIDTAVADARAEIEAARNRAAEVEAEAQAAASLAAAEAALARVGAALDSGAPFVTHLDDLRAAGAEIPQALSSVAETGVVPLAALQSAFPDAAREALEVSTQLDTDGSAVDRFTSFLRAQTAARSLTPREGDDPDAVLSRAEAALRDGDLAAALSELETLPESGLAAMSGWISDARTRHAALTALGDLRAAVETN